MPAWWAKQGKWWDNAELQRIDRERQQYKTYLKEQESMRKQMKLILGKLAGGQPAAAGGSQVAGGATQPIGPGGRQAGAGSTQPAAGPKVQPKEKEWWTCESCNFKKNFAHKQVCYNCGDPKHSPTGQGVSAAGLPEESVARAE